MEPKAGDRVTIKFIGSNPCLTIGKFISKSVEYGNPFNTSIAIATVKENGGIMIIYERAIIEIHTPEEDE